MRAFSSFWVIDAPRGIVFRFGLGVVKATIRAVDVAPIQGGGCLTSIAASAGGMWVTVAQSQGDASSWTQRRHTAVRRRLS